MRTGEPNTPCTTGVQVGVYPRAYGGTYNRPLAILISAGLSPCVRGNRHARIYKLRL